MVYQPISTTEPNSMNKKGGMQDLHRSLHHRSTGHLFGSAASRNKNGMSCQKALAGIINPVLLNAAPESLTLF